MRGHIKKRGDNWSVIIELPKDVVTEKRKQKWYTVKGNKKEAETFLTEKLRELDTGMLIDTKKMFFGEYLDYWITEVCEHKLKTTTLEGYKHNIERHIKPILDHILLEKLTPLHLQQLYKNKLEQGRLKGEGGLSNKSVLAIHRILHRTLEQAVKWQLVVRNVADCVEPPKPKKYEAKFLDEKQVIELQEISKSTYLYIPILIAIYTGMRRGEILGLMWQDIDIKKGMIRISHSLNSTKNGLELSTPKTNRSIRSIAIPQIVIKELKRHKIRQKQNKLKYGSSYQDSDMVCTLENGEMINPKNLSRDFHKMLESNNLLVVRFHDLRHSHASLLVKLGVQPKVISERIRA